MVGMGLAQILETRGANRPEVQNRYIELQTSTFMQDLKCFDGVPEMLDTLRNSGFLIATATMRRGAVSRVVLEGMGILGYFDAIVGADDTPEPKPSGVHILTTCQALNVQPGSAVMVGDTKYDIMAAWAAGVMAVGVTWGLGKREEMAEAGAEHIFDTLGELEEFLRRRVRPGLAQRLVQGAPLLGATEAVTGEDAARVVHCVVRPDPQRYARRPRVSSSRPIAAAVPSV